MISTPLVICLAVASAAVVVALLLWKPRRRFSTSEDAQALARDATFASLLIGFASSIGLAREHASRPGDGAIDAGHGWHGSHLDHSAGGGFPDAGGFGGGDGGGGL